MVSPITQNDSRKKAHRPAPTRAAIQRAHPSNRYINNRHHHACECPRLPQAKLRKGHLDSSACNRSDESRWPFLCNPSCYVHKVAARRTVNHPATRQRPETGLAGSHLQTFWYLARVLQPPAVCIKSPIGGNLGYVMYTR